MNSLFDGFVLRNTDDGSRIVLQWEHESILKHEDREIDISLRMTRIEEVLGLRLQISSKHLSSSSITTPNLSRLASRISIQRYKKLMSKCRYAWPKELPIHRSHDTETRWKLKATRSPSKKMKIVLNVVVYLVDKPSGYWNMRSCWRVSQAVGPKLKSYGERKPFGLWSANCKIEMQTELWQRI